MENSLIPIRDTWFQYKSDKIVVLGNGPSRAGGITYATQNSIPVVTINSLIDSPETLFAVATNQKNLNEMHSSNKKNISIVVPASLDLIESDIRLPIADFDYLEGTISSQAKDIEFRQDFVLLTILNILNEISSLYKEQLGDTTAILYGFDFYSESLATEDKSSFSYLTSILLRQQSLFGILLAEQKPFSRLILENRSARSQRSRRGGVELDKSTPRVSEKEIESAIRKNRELMHTSLSQAQLGKFQIVAELTNNHLGDTKRLEEMVRQCKLQGADIIKVQKRDVDTLYTKEEKESYYKSPFGDTLEAYRKGVELDRDQFEYLTVLCSDLEIPWFSSVLDMPSLDFLSAFRPLSVKAPSTISNHRNFLGKLAHSEIEWLFVSTGGTSDDFISWVNNTFSKKNLVLMQCTSSYPTSAEDCNVRVIERIKNLRGDQSILPGYSSHDVGSTASQLALSLGAIFIEKHVKLGSVDWIHFDGVALDLTTNELSEFVQDISTAEKILGTGYKQILSSEHHKYRPNQSHN